MVKGIDMQMVVFVGISLIQEYIRFQHLPRVYYWKAVNQK